MSNQLRKFKVSKELKPYIRKVLSSRLIPYKFSAAESVLYIEVPLSGTRFHEVVMRAKCEKLTKETGMLHLTKAESDNETRTAQILKEKGEKCFVVAGSNK